MLLDKDHYLNTRCPGHYPCKIFTKISLRLARSRRDWRDLTEIGKISPRLMRSHRDLAEISPWRLLDSKSRRDRGEISSFSPRLPRSHRDCRDLAMMFVTFLISARSRRDILHLTEICRDLAIMFVSFWISARSLRSRHDICWFIKSCRVRVRFSSSRRDWRDLAMKFNSSVSCQDFERHKLLTEIAKI